jgi:phage baseplate assembly protein W
MTQRAISLPFSFDSNGSVSYTSNEGKIWQDRVTAVLMTNLTERIMRPTYGSSAQGASFQNKSEARGWISQAAAGAFANWLPELEFVAVTVEDSGDDDVYIVEVHYKKAQNASVESVSIKSALFNQSGDLLVEGQK